MKKTREEVNKALNYFTEQKAILPNYSQLGTDNYSEIEELQELFGYYLRNDTIPDMSDYLEETSWGYALWIMGKNKALDDVLQEVLSDEL